MFYAKGLTASGKAKLKQILHERPIETEESSLKFSKRSQEEIILWREGRPSSLLRYELSFWSDLARWLMMMHEQKEPYEISFGYAANKLPDSVKISFPNIELCFHLTESDLQKIIPSLSKEKSPLVVHISEEQSIKEITYDKVKGELRIIPKE